MTAMEIRSKKEISEGAPRRRGLRLANIAAAMLVFAAAACASPEEKVAKYTESGQEYLDKGDLARANLQFQNALKIDEEYVPALEGIAKIAEQREDFSGMFGVLQRIVRLDPKNAEALVKMGKIYLVSGDTASALETADKALALTPDASDALALKAAVMYKMDDKAGAADLARRALEADPANTEAVSVIAAERTDAGDLEAALSEIDKVLKVNPDAAMLHIIRLQLLTKLGRTDDLRAGYESLIAAHPKEAAYRRLYVGFLTSQKDFAGARKQLEEIVKLSPDQVDPVLDVVRLDYKTGGAEAAKKTFKSFVDARSGDIDLQFAYGDFLRQQKDFDGAEAVFDALAARKGEQPTVLRAKNEIASLRLLQGKDDEARAIVAEILQADNRNTDALLKRAGMEIKGGDIDSAVADLRAVLTDKPQSFQAKMLMGSAFERKGDVSYASSQYAQAVEDSKKASGPSRVFAMFLMRQNNPARAQKVLEDSLAAHPGDLGVLKTLASVQIVQQDWNGAEKTAKLIEKSSAEDPSVNQILGVAYAGLGDYTGAIEAMSKENKRQPLSGKPLAALVSVYLKGDKADEAEQMLRDTIEADKDDYDARLLLAQVLGKENKTSEMKKALREAIVAKPDRLEATEALYRAHMNDGEQDKALSLIEERIAAAPYNDGLKMLKADYYMATGQGEQAIDIYADVLTRRPGDLLASNNYASLLNQLKDDPDSKAKALKAAEALKGSDNPYFLDTYGWALYQTGDHKGAVNALEKAAKGAPALIEISYHLGAAYMAAGNAEKGRAVLETVVKAGETPYLKSARDLLAQN